MPDDTHTERLLAEIARSLKNLKKLQKPIAKAKVPQQTIRLVATLNVR